MLNALICYAQVVLCHRSIRLVKCVCPGVPRIYQLRKPKTNIQILQQNVLLKQKYLVTFLRQHGPEVFQEVRSAYVDTLSRVLSAHFRSYLAALERLQVRPPLQHITGRSCVNLLLCTDVVMCLLSISNEPEELLQGGWCDGGNCAGGSGGSSGCDWGGAGGGGGRRDGESIRARGQCGAQGCLCAGRPRQHPAPPGAGRHHPPRRRVRVQEGPL